MLFPSGTEKSPAQRFSWRNLPGTWSGLRSPGDSSRGLDTVRGGSRFCHSFGRARKEAEKAPQSACCPPVFKRELRLRRIGGIARHSGQNEKELARRGYQYRKAQKQEPRPWKQDREVRHVGREEGQTRQRKRFLQPSGLAQLSRYGGPTTCHACSPTSTNFEKVFQEKQREPKTKQEQWVIKQKHQQIQLFQPGKAQTGACKGNCAAPSQQKKDVQEASEVCESIREGSGGRVGIGWKALPSPRDGKEGELGKAEITTKNAFSSLRDFDSHPGKAPRRSCPANSTSTSRHPSGCSGLRRLVPCMVDHAPAQHLGKEAVGGHSRGARQCCRLPSQHGSTPSVGRKGQKQPLECSQSRLERGQLRQAAKEDGKRRQRKRKDKRRGEAGSLRTDAVQSSATKMAGRNSIAQAFTDGHGSFGRFLKLVQSKPYIDGSGPRTPFDSDKGEFRLFPSLLAVPKQQCTLKSPRRKCRGRGREHTSEHVRALWALFTFLEGGSPYKHEEQVSLANAALATPWTAEHAALAGLLHDEVHRFSRLRTPEPLGRGLEQLDKLVTQIKNSHYSPGPFNLSDLCSAAMNVRPDRMSLPTEAGIINPEDHLKGAELEAFRRMTEHVPHDIPPEKLTKGCFKVAPDDVKQVYCKLLDSKVATLIPARLALKDSQGKIISGGLFAVPHKETSDRIICDRRPINELERRLVWAKLPHGSLLTQIILPKNCSIRGSGDDLSNYFYLLKHRQDWLHRNTVGSPVSGSDFSEYGCLPDQKYILAFNVIPMGDLNAVDIAQQTHLEILRDCGCMSPDQVLSFRAPVPATNTFEGLYIDDHVAIQVLPKKKFRHGPQNQQFRDEEIMRDSRKHYKNLGIPVSEKKAYTKSPSFTAWGTHVDNATGRVGTPLAKLKQLSQLLVEVCRLPRVTQKVLQKVLGLIVHPAMHQRLIMSLLQEAYIWVENIGPHKALKMPNAVREELLMVSLCLCLCHSNIRHPISTRIGASDASLTGGGRAATLTTGGIAETLYRYSVHKGEPVRLDWEKGRLAPPTQLRPALPELEALMQAHTWNTTHKCRFGHKQHINLLELKMIKAELVDLVKHSTSPQRAVLLVDSRVAAGAWGNRILRSMLGWALVGQKSLHLIWVQSAMNPADHPSRGARIPEPSRNDPILKQLFGNTPPKIQTRISNRKIWATTNKLLTGDHEQEIGRPVRVLGACDHPAAAVWSFKEIFAGAGSLTQAFKEHGVFQVRPQFELIQRGKSCQEHDLLNNSTFFSLVKEASQGHQLWHFRFPCGSFSVLQNMNKGTRSLAQPQGSGQLEREKIGNELAFCAIYLCLVLHEHGSFFTFENPKTSLLWHLEPMKDLMLVTNSTSVYVDLCMYNLQVRDCQGCLGFSQKSTRIIGTMPTLQFLSRTCDGKHSHFQILGKARTQMGWQRRSALAGYPSSFCNAYHKCCTKLFVWFDCPVGFSFLHLHVACFQNQQLKRDSPLMDSISASHVFRQCQAPVGQIQPCLQSTAIDRRNCFVSVLRCKSHPDETARNWDQTGVGQFAWNFCAPTVWISFKNKWSFTTSQACHFVCPSVSPPTPISVESFVGQRESLGGTRAFSASASPSLASPFRIGVPCKGPCRNSAAARKTEIACFQCLS